jgi:hypothetical protein
MSGSRLWVFQIVNIFKTTNYSCFYPFGQTVIPRIASSGITLKIHVIWIFRSSLMKDSWNFYLPRVPTNPQNVCLQGRCQQAPTAFLPRHVVRTQTIAATATARCIITTLSARWTAKARETRSSINASWNATTARVATVSIGQSVLARICTLPRL